MNEKAMEKLPRPTYARPYMSHSRGKNKKLVFILMFITVSEAYLTPNKIIYQMFSYVIQTTKYGTTTKKIHWKYLSISSKYFYTRQVLSFRVVARTPSTSKLA